jgi:imidazolonepropionase-like amidohydrolase
MKRITLFLLLALASTVFASSADITAIVGGTVVIGDGTMIQNGTVILEGNLIIAVGVDLEIPAGATIIDAKGKVVLPGLIDPFTTLGMVEVGSSPATNDSNESTSTNVAQVRAIDGINPFTATIPVTRIAGITTAMVTAGTRNPINGQTAVIDLLGESVDELLVKSPTGLVFNFSSRSQGKFPTTRPGNVALIRQTLMDVQNYVAGKEKPKKKEDGEKSNGNGKVNLKNESLALALKGKIPVFATAGSALEIVNALKVAKEFKLKMILVGGGEMWRTIPQIKEAGIPVLLNATFSSPGESDHHDRYYKLAATLHEAGIPFAFTTGSAHTVRALYERAAMSVTYGLPIGEALKAMTSVPAKILGIDKTHGTLTAGKVANVVVYSGCALQIMTKIEHVFIKGEEIELISRQEKLRDRFIR